jgi:hypothetical protein
VAVIPLSNILSARWTCALLLCAGISNVHAQDKDSLLQRLDDARDLARQAGSQLDSLRLEIERYSFEPATGEIGHLSPEDSAIWREVRAEKRRRRELAAAFEYRRASVGYTFNPNVALGMNSIFWLGDWGAKVDGRVSLTTERRAMGANLSLLYAVHEFYLTGDEMFTRLYLFAGSGYYWGRVYNNSSWFSVPNRVVRTQIGAGTELGLREMHGTRFTPEIGFQGSRFLTRYQESTEYNDGPPRSDFSLYPYYALHINFYFL